MAVRFQRLCRLPRSFPLSSRRFIAADAAHTPNNVIPPPSASIALKPDSSGSEVNVPAELKESEKAVERPAKVHWALGEEYTVGGVLKRGKDQLDRHDEKGLPMWGAWGIPLKIQTRENTSVINS